MKTPWGYSQSAYRYARGISLYSTPSHGGFKLSPERNALIHEAWRHPDEFPWYEEDCEYAIVVLTFPELFAEEEVQDAHNSARNYFPEAYSAIYGVTLTPETSAKLRWAKEDRERELAGV